MKSLRIVVFILIFILPQALIAQEIIYSGYNSEDNRDINFEILGKMNNSYIIYKNVKSKHLLAVYDQEMKIRETIRLSFVPEKTYNIDFIVYPGHFYMIYQYQKNKIVHCMGVKMGPDGKKMSEPVQLDSTRVPILADNKIYNTVYSQDKKQVLVYKMQKKNQILTVATKLFNADLKMLDSTRMITEFDDRKDIYSDMVVDNDGNFLFAKGTKGIFKDNIDGLAVFFRSQGTKEYKILNIDLQEKYIDELKLKIDNLNGHYLLNSFYYTQNRGNIKGLYSLMLDAKSQDTIRSAFNILPDSIRTKINSDGQYRAAFDNLFIRQAIVKKDGGFILTTEDFSSQTRSGSNNNWNRSNYLYNYPSISTYDYYLSNPAYDYYRPSSSYSNWQNTRYYYENILILSLDTALNISWNNIIPKSQSDDDNDNFLSFSLLNVGTEIHFLFNEGDRRQIISNQSILPNGEIKRYPTLKSREAGYEFMPRLAKQVGYREMIIPCIFNTNIAFAKVIFSE